MKNIFKTLLIAGFTAALAVSCVSDDDAVMPPYTAPILSQQFSVGADNTVLDITDWTNFAETGTAVWRIQVYSGNGYAEFNPYASGNAVNVGWLVSPPFTLAEGNTKKLRFQVAQSYVTDFANNKIEAYLTNDFNGDVLTATWLPITFAHPAAGSTNFEFMSSGDIDLSSYSGSYRIAFKVTGSGTNTALDGAYQIDTVTVY